MLIKTLTKHGNSFALVIDKPILDLLSIDPETPLKISTENGALTIKPATPDEVKERFGDSLKEMNKRYGKMLKNLAK